MSVSMGLASSKTSCISLIIPQELQQGQGEQQQSCLLFAVVGAGGKTTLIHALAKHYVQQGKRVLIAPSTKIFVEPEAALVLADDHGSTEDMYVALQAELMQHACVYVGAHVVQGKIIGLPPAHITALKAWASKGQQAQVILCEADGAARKPLKAPAPHEPVLPQGMDVCVGLMGVDALGKPLCDTYVHRPQLLANLCGCDLYDEITMTHLCILASHAHGLFQHCPEHCLRAVVLNKADVLQSDKVAHVHVLGATDNAFYSSWFLANIRTGQMQLLRESS